MSKLAAGRRDRSLAWSPENRSGRATSRVAPNCCRADAPAGPTPARKAGFSPWEGKIARDADSPLEGSGFELPVRGAMNLVFAPSGNWFRPSEIAPIKFVRHSLSDARIPTTKPRFVVGARAVIRRLVTVIDRRTAGACYPPKRPLGIAQIPGRRPT